MKIYNLTISAFLMACALIVLLGWFHFVDLNRPNSKSSTCLYASECCRCSVKVFIVRDVKLSFRGEAEVDSTFCAIKPATQHTLDTTSTINFTLLIIMSLGDRWFENILANWSVSTIFGWLCMISMISYIVLLTKIISNSLETKLIFFNGSGHYYI